jgi:hypothetical protein
LGCKWSLVHIQSPRPSKLVAVIGFAVATRKAKRLLAAALAGLDADALDAAAAGPGWARDVIIAVVALAALLIGTLVRR